MDPKVRIHIEYISLCECIFRSPAVRDMVTVLGNQVAGPNNLLNRYDGSSRASHMG